MGCENRVEKKGVSAFEIDLGFLSVLTSILQFLSVLALILQFY